MANNNIGDPIYNQEKAKRLAYFEKYLEEAEENPKEKVGKFADITTKLTYIRKPEIAQEICIFTDQMHDITRIIDNKIYETSFRLHTEPFEDFIPVLNEWINSPKFNEHFFLIKGTAHTHYNHGCRYSYNRIFVPNLEAILETDIAVHIIGRYGCCYSHRYRNTTASKVRELIKKLGESPNRNEKYFEICLSGPYKKISSRKIGALPVANHVPLISKKYYKQIPC